ncbi:MAG: cytochrome c3 family protein [Bryobacteraceae bacterium]|nr:cytochrome c3 family protein [Bryobacteraceae bacterium]
MRVTVMLWALTGAAGLALGAKDSCLECHSGLSGALQAPAVQMEHDVHARRGLGCTACHGGDPSSDDPQVSMSRARGFVAKPSRLAVPKLCARCHSDAALMHRFQPQPRVDQYAQYMTSIHGKRIASGDAAAAVCTDCHGTHGVRAVKDPLSPVHPLRLPETCGRCHADPKYMAKYGIPTNQLAEFRKSVHWEALEKRGDLSAPSCASCHGNHGATPPGVATVAAVCGTCHVVMQQLYDKSPHRPVFDAMGAAGCVVCHDHHAVFRSSPAMLSGPEAVCSRCHDATSAGGLAAAQMGSAIRRLNEALDRSRRILEDASRAGMEVSEAVMRTNDAAEALVKARVAVHAFDLKAVEQPVREGLAVAAETYQAGVDAMRERDRRRIGLGVSLIAILITMAGLWLTIRRLESKPQ